MRNIIVCIKQTPNTTRVRINPATNNLIREGVPGIMNPADRTALELALDLKRQFGASVTAISMGPRQAEQELKLALSLGADRAVLLCDRRFGGADTLATGYALSEAIKRLPHDLILCGVEAIDGCTGQVGASIGENLGIPAFTYVDSLSVDGDAITVNRDTGTRMEQYRTTLPALACVLRKPASMPEPSEVCGTVEIWDADFADEARLGTRGSPTRVVGITMSAQDSNYLFVPFDWDLERRMEYIFTAGLPQKCVKPLRGSAGQLAGQLIGELYQRRAER